MVQHTLTKQMSYKVAFEFQFSITKPWVRKTQEPCSRRTIIKTLASFLVNYILSRAKLPENQTFPSDAFPYSLYNRVPVLGQKSKDMTSHITRVPVGLDREVFHALT